MASLAALADALAPGLPVLADPDRRAYRAFGMGRGSVARVWLHPAVWWRYLTLIARGRRLRRPAPGEDVLQLGGDAVLDAAGRLAWVHRSRGPEDRPPVDRVIAEMRRAAARG